MAGQGKMLGEMRSSGFATATLEVHNCYDLKLFLVTSLRHVAPAGATRLIEISSEVHNLLRCVRPATACRDSRLRPLPLERQVSQIAALDPKKLRRLADLEDSQGLFSRGRK